MSYRSYYISVDVGRIVGRNTEAVNCCRVKHALLERKNVSISATNKCLLSLATLGCVAEVERVGNLYGLTKVYLRTRERNLLRCDVIAIDNNILVVVQHGCLNILNGTKTRLLDIGLARCKHKGCTGKHR